MTSRPPIYPDTPPPQHGQGPGQPPPFPERRVRSYAVFDETGHVHTPTYSGPDRRRMRAEQAARVLAEKKKFVSRSLYTIGTFAILVIYAGAVLLAPEIAAIRKMSADETAAARRAAAQARLAPKPAADFHLSGKLNRLIETVETTAGLRQGQINGGYQSYALDISPLAQVPAAAPLVRAISAFNSLVVEPAGRKVAASAIDNIKYALYAAGETPQATASMLDQLRKADPAVKAVLGDVDTSKLKAAALLLTLNEFRNNIGSQRSFETDLAVLQRYVGNDPALQAALLDLAPYARRGVLSIDGLQKELQGAAGDIALAAVKGQGIDVEKTVKNRLKTYEAAPSPSAITGETPEAIIARAQKYLAAGNLPMAVTEMKKLQGNSARAAAPFVNRAENTLAASAATDAVTAQIMREISTTLGTALNGLVPQKSLYMSPALQRGGASSNGGYLAR